MASGGDDVSDRRGRPRKCDEELSSRSLRRRLNEEISSLCAPPSPPLVCGESPDISESHSGGSENLLDETLGSFDNFPNNSVCVGDTSNTSFDVSDQGNCDETEPGDHSSDRDHLSTDGMDIDPSGGGFEPDDSLFLERNIQGGNEEQSEETGNLWGTLHFDCDTCLFCRCVNCDICLHNNDGDCFHCDTCMFEYDSEASDSEDFMKFVEELECSEGEDESVLSAEDAENLAMRKELAHIFLKRKASHALIDDILKFLHDHNIGKLPTSAKTLLKVPSASPKFRDVPPGQYWHCGITEHIINFAKKSDVLVVDVSFSCDGVPLFSSSAKTFWPLTCSFNGSPEVFIIGVCMGSEKPADANVYLKDFVEEVIPLCKEGISLDGKTIVVNVSSAICDAPAKCFILGVKYFNGYFSCVKCTAEGELINRRMAFLDVNAPLRSDESFVNHSQKEFHNDRTILETIPRFGCVSCVPYDYMHLLLLGIMRKKLYMWLTGPLKVRLPSSKVKSISERLLNMVGWVPCDFARKPRSLQYVKKFKATELRLILLYVGVIVFHDILPRAIYEHFLVFHVVTTIYVDPAYCKTYLNYARGLAKLYVPTFAELYRKEYVSHNVHSFIHLGNDVEKFGALDTFSAFKYENFYQILTKLIRKGEKPLQQLVNRCAEMKSCGFWPDRFMSHDHVSKQHSQPIQTKGVHCDGPLLSGFTNPQYHSCTVQGGCIVKSSQADRCCMLRDGSVVLVENFATNRQGQTVVIGRELLKREDLYKIPCESSTLGIVYAYTLSNLRAWPASLISQKCVHMPWKSGFAVFPLHHQEKS